MKKEGWKMLTRVTRFIILSFVIAFAAGCVTGSKTPQSPTDAIGEASQPKTIIRITVTDEQNKAEVLIKGNEPLTYTAVKQPSPPAVMLYFAETQIGDASTPPSADNTIIGAVAVNELEGEKKTTRVVVPLLQDSEYEVTSEGNNILVRFHKPEKQPSVSEIMQAQDSTAAPIAAKQQPSPSPNQNAVTKPSKPAWLQRVDFSSEDAGKSTIIIETDREVDYHLNKQAPELLSLELDNTRIPKSHLRPLITSSFQSAINRITPVVKTDAAIISIELREAVPYFVEQTGGLLMVHFGASSIPPKPMGNALSVNVPAKNKVQDSSATTSQSEVLDLEPKNVYKRNFQKEYTGEKIALDFFQTDVKNVFRILRQISGKNFAIDKNVTGKVTLSLDKPVPWDQVLDLVLRMNQLGMVYEGDIIRIATQSTLNKEEKLRQAKLAAIKKSQKQEEALEPVVTEFIPINYANATDDILPHLVLTPKRGKATVDTRNNQIVITDTADKIAKAKITIRKIDQVTPQVIIEARIVEATNSFAREVGTQWGATGGPHYTRRLANGLIAPGALDYNISATNPPSASLGAIAINFSKITGTPFEILDAKISASETKGHVKIISAPKIVTLNNKEAKISQGVKYPYTKLDNDGNTVVEFENIALELTVTPTVTPDNRVSMKILIKNNEVGAVINNELSFTTKEAETELLVNDGDTVVIGGIRKTRSDDDRSGLPGLMDVPLLGWLFKSAKKEQLKEELLIFIRPKIIMLDQRSPSNF